MVRACTRALALAFLILSFLWSCGGGGGGGNSGGLPTTQPSFVQLTSDRLDGGPTTEFHFTTAVLGGETPTGIAWDFGDGQTASGPTAQVSYAAAGVYTVRVTGTFPVAGAVSSELDVTVLDPQGGDVIVGTDVPMPPLLGDVDGDLVLTQLDVARITEHVQGINPLSPSQWRTADYHLDGSVDQLDVDLLTAAVNMGGVLPEAIEPATGPRGTAVRLVSDWLRNVDAMIEVRVGSAPPRPIRRLHPGYGLFVVPMDAVGAPTTAPITEGWVPVELVVDGVTVHAFDFTLTNPPAIVGDEVEMLRSSGHELRQAVLDLRDAMAAGGDALGTNSEDRRVLQAMLDYAATEFAKAAVEIDTFTAQLSPQARNNLAYLCNVAGLRQARGATLTLMAAPGGISALGGAGTGNTTVELIYGLDVVLQFADALYTVTQNVCLATAGVAALSSLAIGPIGFAVGANVLATCASLETASSVVSAVKALWPKMNGDLVVAATAQAGSSPTTYTIDVAAPLQRGVVCGTAMGFAEIIQGLIIEKLTKKLTVLTSFQVLRNFFPFDMRSGVLRELVLDYVGAFLQALGGAFSYALDAAGLSQWLDDLKTQVCQAIGSIESVPIGYSELSSFTVNPSNGGTVNVLAGVPQFEFECASGAPIQVTLRAALPVAGSATFIGTKDVSCGGGCPSGFPTPPGMVAIQSGTFNMGSNAAGGPPNYGTNLEQPVHPVTISYCFWMGETEVTQAQYASLMGTNPSFFPGANNPVEQVSWFNAQAYCAALTNQQAALGNVPAGYQYRLPTEAEWEYACRAGTTTEFNVGASLFCNQAKFGYSSHSNSSCSSSSHVPVASYAPNAWGLYDMHGNVWEWCLDSYAGYSAAAVTDPFVTGGPLRVVRGGSWYSYSFSYYCRSANRAFQGGPGSTNDGTGFRVVLAPVLVP